MEYVIISKKSDYAILQLNRSKVNALNHQMVKEIRQAVASLATDDAVRGVIITGRPHFFSAGLDVIELYGYDKAQITAFWRDLMGMLTDLSQFSKPLVCGVTGHSPAGGCIIAICCDYRVMAEGEKYRIGLNEVAVGILIAENIFHLYAFWLGNRRAYQYLLAGKLLTTDEALQCGLVDEVVPLDQVLEQSEKHLQKLLKANDTVLRKTKLIMRQELLQKIDLDLEAVVESSMEVWWRPEMRAQLGGFVKMLTKK